MTVRNFAKFQFNLTDNQIDEAVMILRLTDENDKRDFCHHAQVRPAADFVPLGALKTMPEPKTLYRELRQMYRYLMYHVFDPAF